MGINMGNILAVGEQKLITECGYKSVSSLKKGDKILSFDNQYYAVQGVRPTSITSSCVDIKINGFFESMKIFPDNKVLVYRGKKEERGSDKFEWVYADDLRVGDMCIYNLGGMSEESLLSPYMNSPEAARFLGYYTLEGYTDKDKNKVIIKIDPNHRVMEDEIRHCCLSAFNAEIDSYEYHDCRYISVVNKTIFDMCSLFGERASNKSIPEVVINADINFLRGFVQPLIFLNRDSKDTYFRPSSSLEVFMGYQRILFRLGGFANLYHCVSRNSKFYYYALILNKTEFDNIINNRIGTWYRDGEVAYLKINDIQKFTYEGEAVSIEIPEESSCCGHLVSMM